MFKYYVLTSGNIHTLIRQFDTLKKSDVVIVINTLNKEYEDLASDFCIKNGIEYHVTKSDGTPSTGKNSVLDLFLKSDNKYMVQVDGDDVITRFGRNLYRTAAALPNPPDVICLYNQLCLDRHDSSVWDCQYDSKTVKRDGWYIPKRLNPAFPHDYSMDARYNDLSVENQAKVYISTHDVELDVALRWGEQRIKLNKFFKRYGERMETFNRIVFLSRKAAKHMRYDPKLLVGEDTHQFYRLKQLAYDGVLDVQMRNERWAFTYIYMNDTTSITKDVGKTRAKMIDYDWMFPLGDALNKLNMYPEGFHLPEFIDPYYEVEQK